MYYLYIYKNIENIYLIDLHKISIYFGLLEFFTPVSVSIPHTDPVFPRLQFLLIETGHSHPKHCQAEFIVKMPTSLPILH